MFMAWSKLSLYHVFLHLPVCLAEPAPVLEFQGWSSVTELRRGTGGRRQWGKESK